MQGDDDQRCGEDQGVAGEGRAVRPSPHRLPEVKLCTVPRGRREANVQRLGPASAGNLRDDSLRAVDPDLRTVGDQLGGVVDPHHSGQPEFAGHDRPV